MEDARERSFIRINDRIDMWDEIEKKFAFWLLLDHYAKELDIMIQGTKEPKTISEVYALEKMHEHKKVTEEMHEVIGAELF